MSSASLCATLGNSGKVHATSVLECHSNTDGRVAAALCPDTSIIWRGARSDCDSAEITGVPHVWLGDLSACKPDPGLHWNSRSSFKLVRGYYLSSPRDRIACRYSCELRFSTTTPESISCRLHGEQAVAPSHSGSFAVVRTLTQDRYIGESRNHRRIFCDRCIRLRCHLIQDHANHLQSHRACRHHGC